MKKRILAALAAASLLLMAGCASTPKEGQSDSILIGGLAPLTGDVAVYGTAAKKGVDLAFKEINAKGGVMGKQLVYDALDEKGDVNEAITAFNRLMGKNIVALIGDVTSKPTMAVAEQAATHNLPMLTPTATAAEVTKYGKNVFRVCFLDPTQGKIMATFASENLSAKKVAVMYNTSDDYSIGLATAFKEKAVELGIDVSNYEGYGNDDKDFKAQLTKIAASNVDALFISDYYNKIALIADQAKAVGVKATLLGGDGWDGVLSAVDASNTAIVEGAYFCNHYSTNDTSSVVQNFLTSFKEAYNEEPNAFAALGYDAGYLMAAAIEKANSLEKQAIIDSLQAIEHNGVTGNITFDENGDPIKSVSIIKIENGKYTLATKITVE